MSVFDAKTEALTRNGLEPLVVEYHLETGDADRQFLPKDWAFPLQVTSSLSRSGLLIVDQAGTVRYLNAQTQAIFADSDMFGLRHGRLAIERNESQRAFESLLERGIAATSVGAAASEAIGVPDHSGAARYAVCIINVYLRDFHAEVLLSLTDFANNSGPARSAFSTVLGLSVREAELAELFSRGLRLEEIATTMGIAFNTARAHLQNICLKTHCSGQIALTRLLCRLSTMPLPAAMDAYASRRPGTAHLAAVPIRGRV